MADRILRDDLLSSDRWLELPTVAARLAFVCLIPSADALGNMEASPGALWRLWEHPLSLKARDEVPTILHALGRADLVRPYVDEHGKDYLHIPRYRQRLRYLHGLHPLSPWTTDEQLQVVNKNSPGAHLTVTGRSPAEVKRSEVKRSEVNLNQKTGASPKNGHTALGARLPDDWSLPDAWRDWAVRVHKLDPPAAVRMSLVFHDYWAAIPGAKGRKTDWLRTWRNWVRRDAQKGAR